ncbi:hypothetical protein [Amycolatopsis sp.]|jgi:hypothetical protein|uniref:hypothetical protein n=1 Tax=Amycolatopsis sp. TaxID=37632 RepID=UPI002E08582C|nr:hypothetical protein [Amycolatopsis sp.]
MSIVETIGTALGLLLLALMALAPLLVALNDRFPVRARRAAAPKIARQGARMAAV